ncbi:replication protein RepB [Bifidobacterium margollesii]|uniref:Replication protein RepB n=1 Tax=Bifidobacterium margollesii TaxID=2020964 RepID=A0A2N5J6R5_9BIFI|nr:HTH domain-containing protein [Bifidobacterium margollesii]PLS29894.1 replication protein RepB [Bifidobacterium margollesii]
MTALETKKRRRVTAKEAAERLGVSERTIRNLVAVPRQDWLDEQATMREAVRAYHDDEGHTWPQTAEHFGLSIGAARLRAYRARKERAEERARRELDGPDE